MNPFKYILDLIYPPACVFCEAILKDGDICPECEKKLPYTKGDAICQKFKYVKYCYSPLYYEGDVRESIMRYKFFGCRTYYKRYAQILSECVENNLDCGSVHMVSWVPISRQRMHKRGYNQAELIAREMAGILELKAAPCLKKIKNNSPQSRKNSASERAENVKNVYKVLPKAEVKGKTILLIDDVVTTGSTISECARMLKLAGAECVYAASVARHKD